MYDPVTDLKTNIFYKGPGLLHLLLCCVCVCDSALRCTNGTLNGTFNDLWECKGKLNNTHYVNKIKKNGKTNGQCIQWGSDGTLQMTCSS